MFICVCKGVTDSQIKQAIADGCGSYAEVRQKLGIGTGSGCGTCACDAKALVNGQLFSKKQSLLAESMSYVA